MKQDKIITNYDVNLQKFFLEVMLQDASSFVRVQNIFNPENFDRSLRSSANFIKEHAEKYSTLPTRQQVEAVTSTKLIELNEFDDKHVDWFLDHFEAFTKRQELNRAILKAADMIETGEFDPVEKLIKDAVQISLTRDMGTDYFDSPKERLLAIKNNNGQVSSGWPSLDRKLFGGMNRGELQIFLGLPGTGKSLFKQNLALNWLSQGLNGVFITLELSEELSSMRIDSMVTSTPTYEIFKHLDDVELKVKMASKKMGKFFVKYMPAQSNVNDFRAYLKELMIKNNLNLDFIMIDYLDLMMPATVKVNPSDVFIKDKYTTEELRNLAKELNVLCATSSQINRSGVDEVELDISCVAGGISKINGADNVLAIYTSRAMKERGRYQLQLLKTRSSSGVGSKVDLDINPETLRITDPGEDAQGTPGQMRPQVGSVMSQIKSSVKVNSDIDEETGEIAGTTPKAAIQSSQLKQMLNNLKNNNAEI